MRGVLFNDKHSYHHWKMMLTARPVISPPSPVTKYVEVPGADGLLDMTQTLTGFTQYSNRKISFEFTILANRAEWPDIYSDILDTLHGNVVEIVFDDDPQYFYRGRVTVGNWSAKNVMAATLTMMAEVEPYKTARTPDPAYKNLVISGQRTVKLRGSRKPTVPTITASTDLQVTFGGNTYNLTAGENILPDIIIRQGENLLEFTGYGVVSIDYRGGRF